MSRSEWRAVRQVQHPEQRHLPRPGVGAAADRVVEAAPAELRLALRREVAPGPVALEQPQDLPGGVEGVGERLGAHEVEVVGGGVVFGKLPPGRARQAADGQVDARRAVLPLVVAVGGEVQHPAVAAAEHVGGGAVDRGRAAAAALVVQPPGIAEVRQHQPVADGAEPGLVERQPGDRADGAGDEQEAVAEPGRAPRAAARSAPSPPRCPRGCRWRARDGRRGSRSAPRRPPGRCRAGSIRRRSARRRRGSRRSSPRSRPRAAPRSAPAAGRSPSSPGSSWCGRGSSRGGPGRRAGAGGARRGRWVACIGAAVVQHVQVVGAEVDRPARRGRSRPRRRGCSTPAARSSRRPGCRSGPRGSRAATVLAAGCASVSRTPSPVIERQIG